jgi:hypothetical protein
MDLIEDSAAAAENAGNPVFYAPKCRVSQLVPVLGDSHALDPSGDRERAAAPLEEPLSDGRGTVRAATLSTPSAYHASFATIGPPHYGHRPVSLPVRS